MKKALPSAGLLIISTSLLFPDIRFRELSLGLRDHINNSFSSFFAANSNICFGFCALLLGIAVAIIIGIILIGILIWKLTSEKKKISERGHVPRYSKYETRRERSVRRLPVMRKASKEDEEKDGEEERTEDQKKPNYCPDCGKKLKEKPNYCPNCGYKLMEEKDEDE